MTPNADYEGMTWDGPFRCERCGGTPSEHRRYRGKVPADAVLAIYAAHIGFPRHSVQGEYCQPTFVKRPIASSGTP